MTSGTSMPCAVDLDPIRSIPVTPKPTSMMTREELAEVLGGCLRLTPRVTCSKCGRPTAPEDMAYYLRGGVRHMRSCCAECRRNYHKDYYHNHKQ